MESCVCTDACTHINRYVYFPAPWGDSKVQPGFRTVDLDLGPPSGRRLCPAFVLSESRLSGMQQIVPDCFLVTFMYSFLGIHCSSGPSRR